MRALRAGLIVLAWGSAAGQVRGASGPFQGEWRTTIGIVKLAQDGSSVTGTYGNAGQFSIKGTVADGKIFTFEYQEGNARGDGRFTLDDTGNAFTGGFQIRGGRGGPWNGWRPDPAASQAEPGNSSGLWLTSLGLMDLAVEGGKARGRYAVRGNSEIEGDVTGRRLAFHYRSFRGGEGWFDLAADGSAFSGAAHGDGVAGWYGWRGRPAPEFVRHAPLVPGKAVDGSTRNLLTYTIRAPERFQSASQTAWPAVVILHGSNMNARGYVETLAAAWPEVARDFILLGINGEAPSDIGPEPRFNYSYVNFVGKSTYKGFPGTDRESPALVAEALEELKQVYPIARYYVGGHSQGGFLTYSLLMNFPDAIAGAFPISCSVIFQCEPGAYTDPVLKRAQRRVPLAIIHGKTDPMVDFGSGQYAAELFGEAGWPAFRFFVSDTGAHMFGRLPVGEAIRWLEAQSADDPARLVAFAQERFDQGGTRDAIAALLRAGELKPAAEVEQRRQKLLSAIDAQAAPAAAEWLAKIRDGQPGWIDGFLAFRDVYQFAPAARDVLAAFDALRAQHDEPARTAFAAARMAFQQGRPADGNARYQEIVDRYYASSLYRTVKRWLMK